MGNHAEVVAAVLGPHGFAGALNGRIFLAGTQKSCFNRCDAGALAVGELVSRTDKDSNASYG